MLKSAEKCKLCSRAATLHGYCGLHYREVMTAHYLDNTDINNLGIVKWAKDLMPEFAFNDTPEFHKELFLRLLSMYDPRLKNKYERLFGFISFRGSGKSTAANTIFVAYVLAHNGRESLICINDEIIKVKIEEHLIVIISETATSAEDFTMRIRDAFTTSPKLKAFYHAKIVDAVDSITGQWTKSSYKFNNCWVIGAGSGQMIRGKVRGVSRPTLIIADDIYSENTVLTEDRRARTRSWWNNAVLNSVDDLKGKIFLLGTIVHQDTVLMDMWRNPRWNKMKVSVMPLDKFHKFIKTHLNTDYLTSRCYLPFDNEKDPVVKAKKQQDYFAKVQQEENWELAWPSRIDLYYIALKYQESVYNNTLSGFYQEYFHEVYSPADKPFKAEYFKTRLDYELRYTGDYTWIRFSDTTQWQPLNIEFGVDLAGKGKDKFVVTIVGSMPDGNVIILKQIIGKFSLRDVVRPEYNWNTRNIVPYDQLDILSERGIVDEIYRLNQKYHPKCIKVGVAGEEELTMDEIRRVLTSQKIYVQVKKRPQTGGANALSKEERIINTLSPYYQTRRVIHGDVLSELEYQLEYLGKGTSDDAADATEVAFWKLDFPPKLYMEVLEDEHEQLRGKTHTTPEFQSIDKYSASDWKSVIDKWRTFL